MPQCRFPSPLQCASRALAALTLATVLAPWELSPPSPARAYDPGEPAVARLQVVLKYVQVRDDADWWGKGEFTLGVYQDRYAGDCNPRCTGEHRGSLSDQLRFSAATGTFYQLDRILPDAGSDDHDTTASAAGGVALHSGEILRLDFGAKESDPIGYDFEPGFDPLSTPTNGLILREADGWGIGSHQVRLQDDYDLTLYYEVRRTPMPDLVPHNLRTLTLDDGRPIACASALNKGEQPSGPFMLVLSVDGNVPTDGGFQMWGLDVAEVGEHCFLTGPLAPGSHTFGVAVNLDRAVIEMDESNNRLEEGLTLRAAPAVGPRASAGQIVDAAASGAGPGLGQVPGVGSPRLDLIVTSVGVRGDCDPGKNDVTVVVKNAGPAGAASFAVRLDPPGGEAKERMVAGLDGGKELEIRFDGVRLEEGRQRLTALVDANDTVAESVEDNNETSVSVNCRDE